MNKGYKDLDHLIEITGMIKDQGAGSLSFPQAIHLLALEIKYLKQQVAVSDYENPESEKKSKKVKKSEKNEIS